MPEPRDSPLKTRSPGREALLARRLPLYVWCGGSHLLLRSAGPLRTYGLLAAVHRIAGSGPPGWGPDPAGGQDRVGTIARTLAAISVGSGAWPASARTFWPSSLTV